MYLFFNALNLNCFNKTAYLNEPDPLGATIETICQSYMLKKTSEASAQMIYCHRTNNHSVWVSALPDDDWQEEHKRLAELDEKDGLVAGPGLGGESDLGGAEDSSSSNLPSSVGHPPLPYSLPSLKLSASSSGLPPQGQ